jgi:hypothetical protein
VRHKSKSLTLVTFFNQISGISKYAEIIETYSYSLSIQSSSSYMSAINPLIDMSQHILIFSRDKHFNRGVMVDLLYNKP